jgi:hypothetical protein
MKVTRSKIKAVAYIAVAGVPNFPFRTFMTRTTRRE